MISDAVEKEIVNNHIRAAIDEVQSLVTYLASSPKRELQDEVQTFELILEQLNNTLED